jgi:hypothetical protein
MLRARLSLGLVAFSLTAAGTAIAGDTSARSDALFEEGKRHLSAGRVAAACAAFTQSLALDPAEGTQLALALCHEQQGDLVRAYTELQAVLMSTSRSGRDDRWRVANAALARVEPRIGRLRVDGRADDTRCADTFRIDGESVPPRIGSERPLMVGVHKVECERSEGGKWSAIAEIATGTVAHLVIPHVANPTAASPAERPAPSPITEPAPPPAKVSRSPWPLVIGGAGIAALGVGSYFGLRAFDAWSRVEAACVPSSCADRSVSKDVADAQNSATVANISFVAGAALVAVGVYLFVARPSAAASTLPPRSMAGASF